MLWKNIEKASLLENKVFLTAMKFKTFPFFWRILALRISGDEFTVGQFKMPHLLKKCFRTSVLYYFLFYHCFMHWFRLLKSWESKITFENNINNIFLLRYCLSDLCWTWPFLHLQTLNLIAYFLNQMIKQ